MSSCLARDVVILHASRCMLHASFNFFVFPGLSSDVRNIQSIIFNNLKGYWSFMLLVLCEKLCLVC